MPTSSRRTAPPETRCLPCLKGGGLTEGWWRDSCGVRADSFPVSSCVEESPSRLRRQPPLGKGANDPSVSLTAARSPYAGEPTTRRTNLFRRGDPRGRPREGQSPSPTHLKIRFRRGRRPRRPESRHYLQPVIPRPVRTLVVGIRNTLAQSQRGTDCHNQ